MEIKEIQTVKIKEEVLLETERLPRVLIELCAQIDNGKLREVITVSEAVTQSIIPAAVPRKQNWKYLEKLIKFLNEVSNLRDRKEKK